MPSGTTTIEIRASAEDIFDLIHNYSRRLEWDPFLREARLLEGAKKADIGVTSRCVAHRGVGGLAMDTVYISFNRPTVASVKMTRGPYLFRTFAATIRQESLNTQATLVTYNYNFQTKPGWLAFLIEPVVQRIFHREIRQRLVALKSFLEHKLHRH
ncbi:MAG: SRPBCC family protein [Planctomycetes bacterium]|nr:SRPBCC family protein [Planctomycetota bacterium]